MNLMESKPGLATFWVQKILEPDGSSSGLLALLLALDLAINLFLSSKASAIILVAMLAGQ